jgi:hypothetical protein
LRPKKRLRIPFFGGGGVAEVVECAMGLSAARGDEGVASGRAGGV